MNWFRHKAAQAPFDPQAAWADRSRAIGEGRIGPRQIGFVPVDDNPSPFQRVARALAGQVEYRTITSVPWNSAPPLGSPTTTPKVETALALTAVYASVSLIARTISGLPLQAFRDVGGKKMELETLPSLFDQPSVQGDLYDWLHRCISSLALHGNAYGLITARDGFGYPTGIEWLEPMQVQVVDVALSGPGSFLSPIWYWRGRRIPSEDLVHIPWFTRPWKVLGLSPLAVAANAIQTGVGAQQFSSDWYANGGVPPGTFKNTMKTVPREEAEEIKSRLVRSIRSHQPIVYGADWDYKPVEISPQEAQFIETMRLTATHIAAIYGVPPDRVGGEKSSSLTYSTQEQDSVDFAQFTILSYTRRLESAFFRQLPSKQYVRFDLDSLQRTDMKTRHEIYKIDRQMGLRNINEIRDLENLPPIEGEDAKDANSYAPLITTGLAGDEPAAPAAPKPRLGDMQPVNGNGNGNGSGIRTYEPRQMEMSLQRPPDIYLTVNVPERQMTMEHHGGDVIVQPSPPAEVRIEQPINVHPAEVHVPVNVTTPEVRIESPVTVNTPEVQIPVTVQPANAPVVTVEAPVTVNTPEVQVQPAEVTVQPAVVNVTMPKPQRPGATVEYDAKGRIKSITPKESK